MAWGVECDHLYKRSRVLALGQVISTLITGTGVFSELLARSRHVSIPTTQSLFNYVLLAVLVPARLARSGRRPEGAWWKYALLALLDVEANYLVVLAYKYTHITSVMLLDCFAIPSAMLLSAFFLGVKYSRTHVLGVFGCLAGFAVLVASDAAGVSATAGANPLLGDLLCIAGSFLYACTNVGQEYLVKRHDNIEYLGMVGCFGALVSAAQAFVLERHAVAAVDWDGTTIAYTAGFVACLSSMYLLTARFLRSGDAALLNLSLLTSDVWAILAGILLFHQSLHPLYFLALALIAGGIATYSLAPLSATHDPNAAAATAATAPAQTDSARLLITPPATADEAASLGRLDAVGGRYKSDPNAAV